MSEADSIHRAVGASLVHELAEGFGEVALVERGDYLDSRNPPPIVCFPEDGCVICVGMTFTGTRLITIDLCDHNWVSQVINFIKETFEFIGVVPDPSRVWVVVE